MRTTLPTNTSPNKKYPSFLILFCHIIAKILLGTRGDPRGGTRSGTRGGSLGGTKSGTRDGT